MVKNLEYWKKRSNKIERNARKLLSTYMITNPMVAILKEKYPEIYKKVLTDMLNNLWADVLKTK